MRRNLSRQLKSIHARLLFAFMLPTTLFFIVVLFLVNWNWHQSGVEDHIVIGQRVGALVAGVVEQRSLLGERGGIHDAIEHLMRADREIVGVALLNIDKRPILTVGDLTASDEHMEVVVPIENPAPGAIHRYVKVNMSVVGPLWLAKQEGKAVSSYLAVVWLCASALAVFLANRSNDILQRATTRLQSDSGWGTAGNNRVENLSAAIAALCRSNEREVQELQHELATKTSALTKKLDRVSAIAAERQQILRQSHDSVARERHRISMEIHDSVGSALVGIRLWGETIVTKATECDVPEIRTMAEHVIKITQDAYKSTRKIVTELRPELLETLNLKDAIAEYLATVRTGNDRCEIELEADEVPGLTDTQNAVLFRTVQEAVANAIKHSKAKKIVIRISGAEEPWKATVTIADDGVGLLATKSLSGGFGMIGMRERVSSIDGVLSVNSNSSGTVVTALI